MKKMIAWAVFLALMLVSARSYADDMAEKHMNKDSASTEALKCEVVDLACYTAKGAHGAEHQACAAKCIGEGGMLGLLYNGKIYIPVTKDFHSARSQFVTKGGETVNVMGTALDKDGLNYIVVSDAKKKKK